VLTSLAALEMLGPAYSWQTKYYLNGALKDGVLQGDLVIQGQGDPYLVAEQFWLHLRDLRELGLVKITGNLLIDNSAFDVPRHDPNAFDNSPNRLYNVGPSATLANFNATRFKLVSDGNVVRIQLDPPLENIIINDQLRLKKGKCVSQQSGWSMKSEQRQHRAYVTFSGHYKSGCGKYEYRRTVLDSDAYLFGLFKHLWQELGGELAGSYALRKVNSKVEPFYVGSGKNLAETIIGTNKFSNNLLAQHLMLTLSREADKNQGATRGHAINIINQWLVANGIDASDLKIDNGSGLSRDITLSSSMLSDLLEVGWRSDFRPEFLASFSLAGIDGTAKKRFRNSKDPGRVRIKTGYLQGVRTMAAYIKTRKGKWLASNLLIEHKSVNYWIGNQIQDAYIQALLKR
jgi:D-alanyl-D-alanine carboxypeptidase/D-alanyl-D-alanine-endopeptidase (penicillin-binding protein 4)